MARSVTAFVCRVHPRAKRNGRYAPQGRKTFYVRAHVPDSSTLRQDADTRVFDVRDTPV